MWTDYGSKFYSGLDDIPVDNIYLVLYTFISMKNEEIYSFFRCHIHFKDDILVIIPHVWFLLFCHYLSFLHDLLFTRCLYGTWERMKAIEDTKYWEYERNICCIVCVNAHHCWTEFSINTVQQKQGTYLLVPSHVHHTSNCMFITAGLCSQSTAEVQFKS